MTQVVRMLVKLLCLEMFQVAILWRVCSGAVGLVRCVWGVVVFWDEGRWVCVL